MHPLFIKDSAEFQVEKGCIMNIASRLAKLERMADFSGYITVVYTDGTTRKLDGGSCIELALNEPDNIVRFEGGDGMLADLLTGLL